MTPLDLFLVTLLLFGVIIMLALEGRARPSKKRRGRRGYDD